MKNTNQTTSQPQTKKPFWERKIQEATGCPDADTFEVLDTMDSVILSYREHLGSISAARFQAAAKEAWEFIQYCRTPEGQAEMEKAERECLGL